MTKNYPTDLVNRNEITYLNYNTYKDITTINISIDGDWMFKILKILNIGSERTKNRNLLALKVIHVHDCTIHVLANAIKSLRNGTDKKKKGVFMGGVVVLSADI